MAAFIIVVFNQIIKGPHFLLSYYLNYFLIEINSFKCSKAKILLKTCLYFAYFAYENCIFFFREIKV